MKRSRELREVHSPEMNRKVKKGNNTPVGTMSAKLPTMKTDTELREEYFPEMNRKVKENFERCNTLKIGEK
ncbi:MAG: hypothetical protein LBM93_13170 [Oscillospiraceae bacterium]|jgi:hypothetical protein|nr:hypothetical protein [Oscillospiraceae bacterium]